MEIRTIKEPVNKEELKRIAQERYGDLVKAVVDVEQGIMAVGGGFHAHEEVLLMEQEHSNINLKPWLGNRSRDVEDATVREQIQKIVEKLILP